MASPVTLEDTIGLPGPIYLRKLRRKADWGSDATPTELRVADVVRAVFLCDPNPYSLFRVETDEELRRIVIGLNGGRPSLTIDSDFIPLLPVDFIDAGVEPEHSFGDTRCGIANALHYDIPATPEQLTHICHALIEQQRKVVHLSKAMLKPLAEQARSDGCRVVAESQGCTVADCE